MRVTGAVLITAADARTIATAIGILGAVLSRQGSKLTAEIEQLAERLSMAAGDADGTPSNTSLATLPIARHDLVYDLLTADAAAEILGCTPGNARALANRGTVRAHCIGGRWLFEANSVRERAARR